jgi:hypothetical protein
MTIETRTKMGTGKYSRQDTIRKRKGTVYGKIYKIVSGGPPQMLFISRASSL